MATAFLFAGAALRLGYDWGLPAMLALIAGLLALASTDLEHFLLPVKIVYPLLGLVTGLLLVAAAAEGSWDRLGVAAACGAAAFVIFFSLNFVNPKWMAFGDVRLAGVIGLGLGWLGARVALLGFFLAFLLGSLVGVALIATKRIERKAPIPFGVFLAAGAYVAVFAGQPLIDLYLRH